MAADLAYQPDLKPDGQIDVSQLISAMSPHDPSLHLLIQSAELEHAELQHADSLHRGPLMDLGRDAAIAVYGPALAVAAHAQESDYAIDGALSTASEQWSAASTTFGVPQFNSLPGAAASLFLDFDGHFQATWGSYSNVTTPPLDRDGDPNSLSAEELAFIEDVWRIVAEDYAPFNINVTTVEPPVLAEGVPSDDANGVALRIAIGGTNQVLGGLGTGIIGYAYYDAFTNWIPNVAYVFPVSTTGSHSSAVTIGSVVSHEAGHSFGLQHLQGAFDTGERWQGIMSSISLGYEDAFWMNGIDSSGNLQDDMAMISSPLNGFGYRPDDHGNTVATASSLVASDDALVGSGVIETNSDADIWTFDSTGFQSLTITVEGSTLGQNLDAVVELLDANGSVLLTSNPADANDAGFNIESGGIKFLRVRSTGEYGRVGQYTITTSQGVPGLNVSAPTTLLTSESGTSDSFSISLKSKPSGDVVVSIASSEGNEVIASPNQFVFTPQNWLVPQSVTITGSDDSQIDGPVEYTLNFSVSSTDAGYHNLAASGLQGINADDDQPGWSWELQGIEAGSYILTTDMQVDSSGNVVVTGSFTGTVDFDLGAGIQSVTSIGGTDPYIAKYSPDGQLLWMHVVGGGEIAAAANSIAIDPSGNIFLTGSFGAPGLTLGNWTLTSQGSNDAYLAQLSSSGQFLWAKSWGGVDSDMGRTVNLDGSGNVVVTGSYSGTADFDPASPVVARTSNSSIDSFVSRFNSAGVFQSVATLGGSGTDVVVGVVFDAAGNTYLSGYFGATIQLGNQTLTSAGSYDGFLLRMNSAGTIEWARQAVSEASSVNTSSLAISPTGELYYSATFTGEINFGPGTPNLVSAGQSDVFLSQWDLSGNLLNAGHLSGTDITTLADLAVDQAGNVSLYGRMRGTVDFEPTSLVDQRDTVGDAADYLLRLDSELRVIAVHQIPQTSQQGGPRDMALDARGNVYLSGSYYDVVVTASGNLFRNTLGNWDHYLTRLTIAPGVTIGNASSMQTSETGQSANITLVLDTQPSADVVINLTASDSSEATLSASTVVFTPANWNVPQSVTISGVDDLVIDGDQTVHIAFSTSSSDSRYDGLQVASIPVTNLDNDQPLVLFSDSFEVSEWNDRWVEDNQNDWFRSSQRATDGSRSAEVDGSASNATLTIGSPIDLSGMLSATLTFDWLIEQTFDSGEYLSLDVSTNGGASWISDVRRLSGNSSAENVWRSESVDLTPYNSSNVKIRFRAKVSGSDEDANVDNVRIIGVPLGPNAAPEADAGGPYAINEGSAVQLSASLSSDSDGTIASYAWDFDNDGQYDDASGQSPSFTTEVSGSHTVGLLVTDNRGGTASTTATILVSNVAPSANAGLDLSGVVGQTIGLTASASSDPGNDIIQYAWDLDNDGQFDDATGIATSFVGTSTGTFTVGLKVSDADGATSTDVTVIAITDTPSEVVVLEDSFEVSEWNGSWIEDSQNDWFRSTQRATRGSRSAEVDGAASNATLTLASSLDLSGFASSILTFDWLIENGFDRGEYLALDISIDGGASWIQDVRRLNGNSSAENSWHSEEVDLTAYTTTNLKIRFRSSVSSSTEDANVDNVRIIAYGASGASVVFASGATSSDAPQSESVLRPEDAFAQDRPRARGKLTPLLGWIKNGQPRQAAAMSSRDVDQVIGSIAALDVEYLSDQLAAARSNWNALIRRK